MPPDAIKEADFGATVEQYRRELQVHCYRLMGTLHDAEDMVQETFLRAWRNRETLESRAAARAWLYKIATNVCLDTLRKNTRRFVPNTYGGASTLDEPIPDDIAESIWLEPYPDYMLPSAADNPEDHLLSRENIALAFVAALHCLPARQRAVLILRDVMDWQANDVAVLLNTTVASVKSALHRARSTLSVRASSDIRLTDEATKVQLEDYVRAWEGADVDKLITLLSHDATFSMPPIPAWYQGHETIRGLVAKTVFSGDASGRWRLLPSGANRQPAFGLYRQTETGYNAYGLQVLTIRAGLIVDIITFRIPALFPNFNLPLSVD